MTRTSWFLVQKTFHIIIYCHNLYQNHGMTFGFVVALISKNNIYTHLIIVHRYKIVCMLFPDVILSQDSLSFVFADGYFHK